MEKNVFEDIRKMNKNRGEDVPEGPDGTPQLRSDIERAASEEEPVNTEPYLETPSDRTYSTLGAFDVIKPQELTDEALADLTPMQRREKRYANAASYFHQYDAMRKTLGTDDFPEAEGLRQKAHDLYEEADRLYAKELPEKIREVATEEQKKADEPEKLTDADIVEDEPVPAQAPQAEIKIPVAGEKAPKAEKIPVTVAPPDLRNDPAWQERHAKMQQLRRNREIDRAAGVVSARETAETVRQRKESVSMPRGAQPKVEMAAPMPAKPKTLWGRIGSWFKK